MIDRSCEQAAARGYDLLIVGGGVYGIALALEATRRGLEPLLLERGDFGGATSWNSLRIVHGGLRYLQRLDQHRFRESVGERAWFLRHFPDQVEPLPCLMPLYGAGLRRPAVFRMALWVEDLLSRGCNDGLRQDRMILRGRILGPAETVSAFPAVDQEALRGGALWYDAAMPDSQRLLMEMLRWACACGARALNYVEVEDLLLEGDRVEGVRGKDGASGSTYEFRGSVVVNSAGPWCRKLARVFDRDVPELFRPSMAFNAFLDREPLSNSALALTPKRRGARTYFLYAWKGRILAGTYHAPWTRPVDEGPPGEELVQGFLEDLNAAVPALDLKPRDVLRLHWGFLPAVADGGVQLAIREVVYDHGARGGPRGLYSVSGVKFTTARLVAAKTLHAIFGSRGEPLRPWGSVRRPPTRAVPRLGELKIRLRDDPDGLRADLRRLIAEEAVLHLDDLLLRRTDWGIDPREATAVGEAVRGLLGDIEGATTTTPVPMTADLAARLARSVSATSSRDAERRLHDSHRSRRKDDPIRQAPER